MHLCTGFPRRCQHFTCRERRSLVCTAEDCKHQVLPSSYNFAASTSPVSASQVVQLVLLWAVFLTFQMVKSKYGICTKEYLVLFLAQTVFCISVTTFFMRRELADLGKPAAQQHRDPEMQQLLLGQRGASPDSKVLLSFAVAFIACICFALLCLLVCSELLCRNCYLHPVCIPTCSVGCLVTMHKCPLYLCQPWCLAKAT